MSQLEQLDAMPAWPILMNSATAALYLELSQGSFLGLARRAGLRPVDLGIGVLRWRRSDLDELVTALPAKGSRSDNDLPVLEFDAALKRSAERAASGRARSRRGGP